MNRTIASIVFFASFGASASTIQEETCTTLYPNVELNICIQATEHPTFALLHDYMEMAKLNIKMGKASRAVEFIDAAQMTIGIK